MVTWQDFFLVVLKSIFPQIVFRWSILKSDWFLSAKEFAWNLQSGSNLEPNKLLKEAKILISSDDIFWPKSPAFRFGSWISNCVPLKLKISSNEFIIPVLTAESLKPSSPTKMRQIYFIEKLHSSDKTSSLTCSNIFLRI